MSGRCSAFMAAFAALAVAHGHGSVLASDYDFANKGWNGLSYLIETAKEAKVEVDTDQVLDLTTLTPDEVLLWVYPPTGLPVEELLGFVREGGRLIIADDVGGGGELLAAIGVERSSRAPARHLTWFGGVNGFPVVDAQGDHFLFFNVDRVIANHASTLSGEGTPIASFDEGGHLAVERRWGAGAVLAVADSSMLINEMLTQFYGNKQFAANLTRVYCTSEPCRIRILGTDAVARGEYRRGQQPTGAMPQTIRRAASGVNDMLDATSNALQTPEGRAVIFGLLSIIALVIAGRALSRGRVPPDAPHRANGGELPPQVEVAAGLATVRGEADFFGLARTLADQATMLLERPEVIRAIASEHDLPDAGQVRASLVRGAATRIRSDLVALRGRQAPVVSAEQFSRLYDDVKTLERALPTPGRSRQPR